ncbi:ribose 5-phosphate isomerase B (plasmid) [Chloroflexota bacterium]|nr:ribose 5-phosphate isomerase B [Chloroflexota bacterium]
MIALGSDHAGLPLKKAIAQLLDEMGIVFKDYGTYSEERCNYPEFGYKAAVAVASGECEKGIICCGSGIGISLAANKVEGIRCVVCSEPYSALLSRQHNDTNMLAMGSRVVGTELAKMIVRTWLDGEFEGGRHAKRVEQIMMIDKDRTLVLDADMVGE